jgi:hypothetical protein
MAVTLTALGDTLDITIVDGNFEKIQDLMRESLLASDLTSQFRRIRISRYISGKLVSSTVFANPFRDPDHGYSSQKSDFFDITDRPTTHVPGTSTTPTQIRDYMNDPRNYAMEFLGKPGPSFWWSWQEDAIDPDIFVALSVLGWAPTGWPYRRYPDELCFSRWLTVPGASIRAYVPQRGIATVRASCSASTAFWQQIGRNAQSSSWTMTSRETFVRSLSNVRFGLIVDTNPKLFADEFVNNNENIIGPDGNKAPRVSWKVFGDETKSCSQRESTSMEGEVELQGGRWYNFRFAYRAPGHLGWVGDNGTTKTFIEGYWENALSGTSPYINKPSIALANAAGYGQTRRVTPPWVALFESGAISVETANGRLNANIDSTANAEFDTFFGG